MLTSNTPLTLFTGFFKVKKENIFKCLIMSYVAFFQENYYDCGFAVTG